MIRSRLRRRLLVALLAAIGLLACAVAVVVLPRRAAIACLRTFQEDVPADLEGYDSPPEGFELLTDPDRFGVHRAWVARPGDCGPHPVLVFVHGVVEEGLKDGRIVRAIDAFRRGGFVVVAPEIPGLVDPSRPDRDPERMLRLLAAVEAQAIEGGDGRRMGVVGISVGGAFALNVCGRHRAAGGRGPLAICAIGAPEDVRRVAVEWFALTLPEEGAPYDFDCERRDVAGFARNFVYRSALRHMLQREGQRDVVRTWLEANRNPTTEPPGLETEAAQAFAKLAITNPPYEDDVRERVLDAAWDSLHLLSPAAWREECRHLAGVAVFLLHGEGDPLVPVAELYALRDLLGRHTLVVPLRSRMIGHTQVADVDVGEKLAHVFFMHDFFEMVGR